MILGAIGWRLLIKMLIEQSQIEPCNYLLVGGPKDGIEIVLPSNVPFIKFPGGDWYDGVPGNDVGERNIQMHGHPFPKGTIMHVYIKAMTSDGIRFVYSGVSD